MINFQSLMIKLSHNTTIPHCIHTTQTHFTLEVKLQSTCKSTSIKIAYRSFVFATNSDFLIPLSLQPDDVHLWYFTLTFFDITSFIVWNIKGLRHWVAMKLGIENQSLWQKLNSFVFLFHVFIVPTINPKHFLKHFNVSAPRNLPYNVIFFHLTFLQWYVFALSCF